MGKTGEEGLYNMGKRLGTKRGLGGDEFELLLSSNGGALARDWSSLAAQKARVSWGKIEGGLGVQNPEILGRSDRDRKCMRAGNSLEVGDDRAGPSRQR
jgi:hypothetical protein